MNRQIKRLGVFLILCYSALFIQLNVVQVFKADELNDHPENSRVIKRDFNRPRGVITSADGALLARSVEVPDSIDFTRVREYPEGDLFGQITGYYSFLYGASGVERTYNDELTGQTLTQQLRGFADLLVDEETVGNVELTVRRDLQASARDALGPREGSVVVLDPRDGALEAFWSFPSYDPNPLSSLDLTESTQAWDTLNAAPGNPLLAHQYQERYFPGSTFKVVTGGVGLQTGTVTGTEPVYPPARSYTPPQTTNPIFNFGGEVCGGDLFNILRVSCNSAFAQMGVETIGPQPMIEGTAAWGFNSQPPIDLPSPAASAFPTDFTQNLPKLAQASIGQNDVQATPLQMALVAAAVANGGSMPSPHVMGRVTDREGGTVEEYEPDEWTRPLAPEHASTMREAMIGVVEAGTATSVRIPGVEVGAKTGTAQLGDGRVHTWMIAFAGPPGGVPEVAVAVVVLNQPETNEFTGGQIAGPIVKRMITEALAVSQPSTAAGPAPTTTAPAARQAPAPTTTPSTAGPAPTTAPSTAPPPTTVASTTAAPTSPVPTSAAPPSEAPTSEAPP